MSQSNKSKKASTTLISKAGHKTKLPKAHQTPKQPKWSYSDVLSDCAAEYGSLLADPFRKEHHACVPTLPAFDSLKMTVWVEGTFVTGTAGFGYVILNPHLGINFDGSNPCAFGSTSVFTGTTAVCFAGSGTQAYTTNSPYGPFGDLPADLRYRLVASGLRCWYSGPINVMGGDMVCLQEPNHGSLAGYSSVAILAYNQSRRFTPSMGTRYGVTWVPVSTAETAYAEYTPASGNFDMVTCVQTSAGLTFSFEAFMHYELTAAEVRGKTPSHSDAVGMAAAITIASNPLASTSFASSSKWADAERIDSFMANMGHYALRGVSGIGHLMSSSGNPYAVMAGQVAAFGADMLGSLIPTDEQVKKHYHPGVTTGGPLAGTASTSSSWSAGQMGGW
jgi:hypothetical protein